jgi:hypothetical protein
MKGRIEMAIFMDTGNGDIYAAENRELCYAAMLHDSPDLDTSRAFEVPGTFRMRVEKEDGSNGGFSTLAEEYIATNDGYCICSENC